MLLACGAVSANAEIAWRSTPGIVTGQAHAHGGSHRHSGDLKLYLREGEGAEVMLRTPDLQEHSLALADDGVSVRPSGVDGYHRLLARRVSTGEEQVALRYFYVPGKPSGHSPAEQVLTRSAHLEILPMPLPREHWRYESGEMASFRVTFDGRPLAQSALNLTTSNGTLLELMTDENGNARFLLPEDFSQVRPGREANRPAEFIVEARHTEGGRIFSTTLSADYHVNPGHWQSRWGGAATLALGFLAGLGLVRRRSEAYA